MIDLETIEREIDELEARGSTTYALCERLSWLYVVRDHLLPPKQDTITNPIGGSDFLDAASGVPYSQLMKVIDEHMEAVKVVYPKEYESVLARIRAIR